MRWWTISAAILALAALSPAASRAQYQSESAGCVVKRHVRTCNWEAFKQLLNHAQTVAVESPRQERFMNDDLRKLAQALGKTVTTGNTTAELAFTVIPANEDGLVFGPADQDLAQLRVYAGGDSRSPLVWVETYHGQADIPWPAIVGAVIRQFQEHMAKN